MKGYWTTTEAAEKWGVNVRTVKQYCMLGKIPNVERAGRFWMIPENSERPADLRVKSGRYKEWRKTYGKAKET